MCLLTLALAAALGQAQSRPDWRRIGPSAAEMSLASPVTGPVERVWFSPGDSVLYARSYSGKTFQTADFETWAEAPGVDPPAPPEEVTAVRLPEPGATVLAQGADAIFALKQNVFRSRDGGRSWESLTTYKTLPVIGGGQHSVAVSHSDPDQIVVANDFGVWRSMDGGLTWSGLNQLLPNLPVRRVLSTPTGAAGTRIQVENLPPLELPPGGAIWVPAAGVSLGAESAQKERIQAVLGTAISAYAAAGARVYAGTADGRLWFSSDGGATFQDSALPAGVSGPVERIYVDSAEPRVAVAALAGSGIHVLRTFNGGDFWDAMDSDLPSAPAHSVTADSASGAVYVATDKGVFWTTTDLMSAASAQQWTNLSAGLPSAPAYDVRLDPAAVQLYVAVDGYGVYAAAAPHRQRPRVINAADFSARPAAPGSLVIVLGAQVNSAAGANLPYPVLGASDTASQVQVPFGAVGPTVTLALDTTTGAFSVPLPVQPVSPAIFVGQRDGVAMLYDADSGLLTDGSNPAHSNGRMQILATGLGQVRPNWPAGLPAPLVDPPAVVAEVQAFLDGAPLRVTRATLAPGYIGFYLVEVQLPVIANFGSSQLWLAAGGLESNRVQVVIEP
jgi:uncharacterized protein (TIGR03437 family)